MVPTLENLVRDIIALDPSLASEEEAVRTLVAELIKRKPVIAPDAAFVRELKKTLLAPSVAENKPVPGLPFWLVYAAPVGVVAVLVLMLLPRQDNSVTPVPEVVMPIEEARLFTTEPEAASQKQSDTPAPEDTALFSTLSLPTDVGDSFALAPEPNGESVLIEYIAVTAPSFVVVEGVGNDGVSAVSNGVSTLILPETTTPLVIELTVPLLPEQLYTATLYRDNGDGVFSVLADHPVLDASGAPLQQLFSLPQ